jgi:capsid protein
MQSVLAGAIPAIPVAQYATDMAKFEAVLFKPRGWSWIDPTKEVAAYKEAIKAGLTTLTDVIAATADGRDIEDVIQTRRRELDMLEEADIEVDTTVQDPIEMAASKAPAAAPAADTADIQDEQQPPARVLAFAKGLQ